MGKRNEIAKLVVRVWNSEIENNPTLISLREQYEEELLEYIHSISIRISEL